MMSSLVAFTRGFTTLAGRVSVSSFLVPAWTTPYPAHGQVRGLRRGARPTRAQKKRATRDPPVSSQDSLPGLKLDVPWEYSGAWTGTDSAASSDFRYPLSLLHSYRRKSSQSLLTHLSMQDADIQTFVSLAKALIRMKIDAPVLDQESRPVSSQSPLSWGPQSAMTLEECTNNWYSFEKHPDAKVEGASLEQLTDSWQIDSGSAEYRAYQEAMGELWYTVGELILRAANMTPKDAERTMQNVYLILAEIHSQGLVPADIYNFEESDVPKGRRKPPYLHTLGLRIMATLSEATWKSQARDYPGNNDELDHRLPELLYGDPNPRVRKLDPNVWLELVLWSCLRQGYFFEAARLLSLSCLSPGHDSWIALTWDQVLELQIDHHKRHQSWFDRVMTLVEGYSEDAPLIEMPSKSISSEVVLSILNGLLSLPKNKEGLQSAQRIAFYVFCRSALGRSDPFSSLALHSLAQQISETVDLDPIVIGNLLLNDEASDTSESHLAESFEDSDPDKESLTLPAAFTSEQPIPMISHLLSVLDAQALRGDINEAISTFDQICKIRRSMLLEHISMDHASSNSPTLEPSSASEQARPKIPSDTLVPSSIGTGLDIPPSTLSALLRLLLNVKNVEVAKYLLYESGFVTTSTLRATVLQPELLRAAVILSDKSLLQSLIFKIRDGYESMSNEILFAVYEAQVSLQDFEEVRRILTILQTERGLVLPVNLAAVLAAKYITLPDTVSVHHQAHAQSLKWEAKLLLTDLLSCKFLPKPDRSKAPNYTPIRELLQFGRIVQSALRERDKLPEFRKMGYAHRQLRAPTAIPVEAFNTLLRAVMAVYGVDTSLALFHKWCRVSQLPARQYTVGNIPVVEPAFEGSGKVVTPSIESVQIVLKSALEDLDAARAEIYEARLRSRDPARRLLRWVEKREHKIPGASVETRLSGLVPNRELLQWGATMLRGMGLDEDEVNEVIPGTFPRG